MKKVVFICLFSWLTGLLSMWAQADSTLFVMDGHRVGVDEYSIYCSFCGVPESQKAEQLGAFIDFKLKAWDAHCRQMDTLPDFRRMLAALAAEVGRRENTGSTDGFIIRRSGWVKVEILTIPIRQDAGETVLNAKMDEMEAIYREIIVNPELSLSKVAEQRQLRGGEFWMPLEWFLPEEAAVIKQTSVGTFSKVFQSVVGVNLLRVIDKTDDYSRTQVTGSGVHLPLRDILLALYWDNLLDESKDESHVDDRKLAAYFKRNKKAYKFDFPYYKGLVVYCANKGDARIIRRKLRKTNLHEWPELIRRMVLEQRIGNAKSEYGLFRIGSNDVVDCLAFKCIHLSENADYPYIFIVGKILKDGPERYDDVKSQVLADYTSDVRRRQMTRLREKYAVKVYDECLYSGQE